MSRDESSSYARPALGSKTRPKNQAAISEEQPDANAKKRKRDALNESDPKSQEFLTVMQASKISVDNLHGHEDDSVLEPPTKKAAVDEPESRDGYQSMPTQPTKRTAIPPPNLPHELQIRPAAVPSADVSAVVPDEQPASHAVEGSTEDDGAGAIDDDDWLRNRTNRLLDLADEDDVFPVRSQPVEVEPTGQPETENGISVDVIPIEKTATSLKDSMTKRADLSDDATLGAIRKTARIFCRNLPYDATTEDLRTYFEKFGEVEEVRCL